MAIVSWIIECDNCGREIDATQESFVEKDEMQLCNECANEETPKLNEYLIILEGKVTGYQKVRAKNEREAKEKSDDNEIVSNEAEPEWKIVSVERRSR